MEGNQTRFVESSDSDIRELVANAVPESTKRSTKCLRAVQLLRFSGKYSFLGQSLNRRHYQPTYQPPEGVYLVNNHRPFVSRDLFYPTRARKNYSVCFKD